MANDRMLYKPDWPDAKVRWEAFWRGETPDRVLMMVTAPKNTSEALPEPPPPTSIEDRWLNTERIVAAAEATFSRTYYAAEALPVAYANLGPAIVAGMLGCAVDLDERTMWLSPILDDLAAIDDIGFDEQNGWWLKICEMTEALQRASEGKFMVGLTDLHGPSDHLSALRGNAQLCVDVMEQPDAVEHGLRRCLELYWEILVRHAEQIYQTHDGSSCWMRWWAPGRSEVIQEDFADLISLEHYRRLVQPVDVELARRLDHSVFHIHETMPRLIEGLVEIPDLGVVQWAGIWQNPRLKDHLPYLRRIQAAGKGIYMRAHPSEVERVIKSLSPRGLCLTVGCGSPAMADDLVAKAEVWTRQRLDAMQSE